MYRFSMDFDYGESGGVKKNIVQLIDENGIPDTYIEVGVFEGSTILWLNDQLTTYTDTVNLYAIDPHVGSNDMGDDFELVADNFAYNMTVCENNKVTHIKKHSEDGLIDLINKGVKAQLIYIDGDHRAGPVLCDLVLAWKLLVKGGIILCDDTTVWKYEGKSNEYPAQLSPRMAVESFIQCHWHELQLIPLKNNIQTAFRKIVD